MHQRARLGIGYLTQEPSVFRKLTVEQNILAILETCKIGATERAVRLKAAGLDAVPGGGAEVLSPRVRAALTRQFDQQRADLKQRLARTGLDVVEVWAGEPYDRALVRFFKARERRLRT